MKVGFAARALVDSATALNEAIVFLMETPGAGRRTKTSGLRRWRIGRTPFLLFYRHSTKTLKIGRIRHEHENWRNPH